MVIYSFIKLTLVSGSESALLSTRVVMNDADILQFNDVFKLSVAEDLLFTCSVQLRVTCVIEGREQCLVTASLILCSLCLILPLPTRRKLCHRSFCPSVRPFVCHSVVL